MVEFLNSRKVARVPVETHRLCGGGKTFHVSDGNSVLCRTRSSSRRRQRASVSKRYNTKLARSDPKVFAKYASEAPTNPKEVTNLISALKSPWQEGHRAFSDSKSNLRVCIRWSYSRAWMQ
jgi:hypothetical protein